MYYVECHYTECRFAECPYVECPYAHCPYAECPYDECPYDECPYHECPYEECHYAECRYADCQYVEFRGAVDRANYIKNSTQNRCLLLGHEFSMRQALLICNTLCYESNIPYIISLNHGISTLKLFNKLKFIVI
jgi:hypothetical protein